MKKYKILCNGISRNLDEVECKILGEYFDNLFTEIFSGTDKTPKSKREVTYACRVLCREAAVNKLFTEEEICSYVKEHGASINGFGKGSKTFELIKDHFNLEYYGSKLASKDREKGDFSVKLEWSSFERSFCNIDSEFKMDEIFHKENGKWSSLSKRFTDLDDTVIEEIKSTVRSCGGEIKEF